MKRIVKPQKPTASRLHLGCGSKAPPGWVNIDGSWNARLHKYPRFLSLLVALRLVSQQEAEANWSRNIMTWDLRNPLPFDSAVFDAIYASHLLEHLYYDEATQLLNECHRVMRPGGLIRLVVPDLRALVEDYLSRKIEGDEQARAADGLLEMMMLRSKQRPHHGPIRTFYQATADFHSHKWLYDQDSLGQLLSVAGFINSRRCGYLESAIDDISEVEEESRLAKGTLCLEAQRR